MTSKFEVNLPYCAHLDSLFPLVSLIRFSYVIRAQGCSSGSPKRPAINTLLDLVTSAPTKGGILDNGGFINDNDSLTHISHEEYQLKLPSSLKVSTTIFHDYNLQL